MQDEKIATDLDIARQLAASGIPVFTAPPSDDPRDTSGFRLPRNWQQTPADPAALDAWQPGWAVCMVTGCGLDLIDLDLYASETAGDALGDDLMPVRYGVAATASGGVHVFVRSLGVASRNALMPGVDIKAGTPDSTGRGFAFIAPTIKKSKVTGQPAAYSWVMMPDAARAIAAADDQTGRPLAELITRVRKGGSIAGPAANGTAGPDAGTRMSPGEFMRPGPWADVEATLKAGRNEGVMKLAAALRGQGGWSLEAALAHMYEYVWPLIDQGQGGHEFTADEFEFTIQHAWRAWPDGRAEALRQAEEHREAAKLTVPAGAIELTDAYLTDRVFTWVLNQPGGIAPRLRWARGLGWLLWTGQVWLPVADGYVRDQVREFFHFWYGFSVAPDRYPEIAAENSQPAEPAVLAKMSSLLSKARIAAVTDLAHGYHLPLAGGTYCWHGLLTLRCANCSVMLNPAAFDASPDLLNTPGGVVDLRTGEVLPHDSSLLLTRITSGSYEAGFRHEDWDKALEALEEEEREWFRQRIGQGITGHPPGDGIMIVLQGTGENGKTACTTDGPVRALGDYASMASHKLISAATGSRSEHSTEIADLRGRRLLIGEELAEGRSIDVTALKRIQDVGKITARYVHRDNITFDASHTLLVTTNYVPQITETDHGTWRRLALLRFPYTFRKTAAQCTRDTDRLADPGLKQRIKTGAARQHDAIVTWAVEGAIAWYRRGFADKPPTERVTEDTRAWRAKADLILGYWDEKLEPDPAACITADDMRDHFNAWITENGHREWSREVFGARFEAHEETTRYGVEKRREKNPRGLVPWPLAVGFLRKSSEGAQKTVWRGVRPKSQVGLDIHDQVAQVAELGVNLPSDSRIEDLHRPLQPMQHPPVNPGQVAQVAQPSAPSSQSQSAGHERLERSARSYPDTPPAMPPDAGAESPKPRRKTARTPGEPTPAQARKAAEKAQKLADAEGPVHQLPVIVARDPAGGLPLVLSCTLEEARQAAEPALAALSVDVEHSGFPVGHPDYVLRLVQLGDEHMAVVFDPDDPAQRACIADLIRRAGQLHAHSAIADLVPLAYAGLGDSDAMWAKMTDSVLIAKLADPALAGSDESQLKELAADLLGGYAVSKPAEVAKNALFKAGGWLLKTTALTPREKSGWAMARKNCETFLRYAGCDVLDLAAVLRVLPRPPAGD